MSQLELSLLNCNEESLILLHQMIIQSTIKNKNCETLSRYFGLQKILNFEKELSWMKKKLFRYKGQVCVPTVDELRKKNYKKHTTQAISCILNLKDYFGG